MINTGDALVETMLAAGYTLAHDLDAAAAYAESIGARRAASGDQSPNFIVFLDPSGHPFCLCA